MRPEGEKPARDRDRRVPVGCRGTISAGMTLLYTLFMLLFCVTAAAGDTLGLPPLAVPADNPQSDVKVALGRRLFEERRFSGDGSVSCASCHQPDRGFSDGRRVARGIRGIEGTRNTPSIVNAAFYTRLFLDGRRDSLETQALDPMLNPIEHGLEGDAELLAVIIGDPKYVEDFADVFGIAPEEIRSEHVARAIASFERTLVSADSAFDRYFFGGDRSALSASAVRGLRVFRRKGNCANCHEISWNQALFTDNRFYNLGVSFGRLGSALSGFLEQFTENPRSVQRLIRTSFSPQQQSELGRFQVTGYSADIGKFRTPTLRNVELTAPYMHDGSLQTLEEVVEYYDRGGDPNPFLDPAIFALNLSAREKSDLVAFLKSLTGSRYANVGNRASVK